VRCEPSDTKLTAHSPEARSRRRGRLDYGRLLAGCAADPVVHCAGAAG
jgi:hypothetical protein